MPDFGGGYAMNPNLARQRAMGAQQPTQIKPMGQPETEPGEGDDKGIGSAATGYAGPENGPFECGHCIHFDGQGTCNNPEVQADPEVNGKVEEDGCCNLFSPGEEGGEQDELEEHEATSASSEPEVQSGANYNG